MCTKVLICLSMMICIRCKHMQVSWEQVLLHWCSNSSFLFWFSPIFECFSYLTCFSSQALVSPPKEFISVYPPLRSVMQCPLSNYVRFHSLHSITIIQSLDKPILCQNVAFIEAAMKDPHHLALKMNLDKDSIVPFTCSYYKYCFALIWTKVPGVGGTCL